jgi:threonine dehydrogenase-like Zn-dependent dehydrogenase
VQTEFSAPKHGTELGLYHASAPSSRARWDRELGLFLPDPERQPFPLPLGNMGVGTVTAVGAAVTAFQVGDRVFGHMPVREVQTVPAQRLRLLPSGMTPQAAVCLDPAEFALGAVRDAHIRLGDHVAVFGCGAIGLLALQMARLQGAAVLFAVDPLPVRRQVAQQLGADAVFDPATEADIGLALKLANGRRGLDVAIEASGSYAALQAALRSLGFGATLVTVAVYKQATPDLVLGAEWHHNRIRMVSSRANSDPNPDHPRWSDARIVETAFTLLRDGKVATEPLVTPIVPFAECVAAYQAIDEHPEQSIKLGITY